MTLAIDDDVRTALSRLLCAMGHQVRVCASAEDFEAAGISVGCAIADVHLPGLSGLELRERLCNRMVPTPVVLITGDGDRLTRDIVSETPLVTTPFDDVVLEAAIGAAVSTGEFHRGRHAH